MERGIVYILTNPCLEGWVKIGMSEKNDIEERLKELNNPSNIPLSFRAYAIYYVDKPLEVEQSIHSLIDIIDPKLRAIEQKENGRTREREFFRLSESKAFDIFQSVAKLRGDKENLKLIQPTAIEQKEEEIVQPKKSKLTLKNIGIPDGATITFFNDDNITCIADISNNKLKYENEFFSLSALAVKLLNEKCGWNTASVAGGSYFKYKGETLNDIRKRIEEDVEVSDN